MRAGARASRVKAALVLAEVQRGRPVTLTYRNRPVAVVKPLRSRRRDHAFEPIGFALWAGRKDIADVSGWVRKIRRARFARWRVSTTGGTARIR
jgi:prevent-host-death family protein